MKAFRFIASLFVVLSSFLLSSQVSAAGSAPVHVVNTPLPVTVENLPSVNVANTPGVTVNNTASNPVPITGSVNVNAGPRPSDMLTLTNNFLNQGPCSSGRYLMVVPSDGSTISDSSPPFVVPDGKVFVITSVETQTTDGPSNGYLRITLARENVGGGGNVALRFGVTTNVNGSGVNALTTPPGIVIKHGVNLCVLFSGVPVNGTGALTDLFIVGYLADDI